MTVSLGKHWNTWDGAHPAAMVHLPTGIALRMTAYSAKENTYFELNPGPQVQLHEHSIDGDYVRVIAKIADSEIELTFAKKDAFTIVGKVSVLHTGEWGLRFWLNLEVGFTDVRDGPSSVPERPQTIALRQPPASNHYTQAPTIVAQHRSTWCSVVTDDRPVFSGLYDDPETLRNEFETSGYYAPHQEVSDPRWAVLRFNGQANSQWHFAAGLGNDETSAVGRANAALRRAPEVLEANHSALSSDAEAFAAVRDVVSWNTIWDIENARPLTTLTRNWLTGKFGGWGVWLDDILFNALLAAACGDWENAYANLDAALTTVSPEGNLPCLRTAFEEWVDRSQPPIAGYVIWRIHELTGDNSLLVKWLPTLVRAHDWWFEHRDNNADGLIEFGSSPTGTGAFVHTKQAALDEAAMDNLPAFDEAEFDLKHHTLDLAEPALNSLVSLEGQLLARIATRLAKPELAARLSDRASQLNTVIQSRLWDDERNVFAGRRWNGEFVRSLAPTSFYPLVAGAATEEQTAHLIDDHLRSEAEFWGDRILPASTFDDPASEDDVYWRGRIWPPLVFWTWEGLRRAGHHEQAREVADRSWAMFAEDWRAKRACRENYHRTDLSGDDTPDSDPFYSWGALIPLMQVLEPAENSPWEGRIFDPAAGSTARLIESIDTWTAVRDGAGVVTVSKNEHPVVVTSDVERVAVKETDSTLSVEAIGVGDEGRLSAPHIPWEAVVAFYIDGEKQDIPVEQVGEFSIGLDPAKQATITIWHIANAPDREW